MKRYPKPRPGFRKSLDGFCEALAWAEENSNGGARLKVWTGRNTFMYVPLYTFRVLQDIAEALQAGRQKSTINGEASKIAAVYGLSVHTESIGWIIGEARV